MNEMDVDAAIETAAERTRQAQERLVEKDGASPEVILDAVIVEIRAEDLHELAADAADEAADGVA